MKNKLLIALTLVMVLSLTFAFVACDSELDVTKIELMDGSFQAEYTVGATVSLSSAKIKVTFSDGTHKEVALTADMLNKAIDTSAAGETTYTITYNGVAAEFTIKVVNPKEYEIETFELPAYITNALKVAATEGPEDANFKVANRMYEVGNANAFLVNCIATGYNLNDDEVTIDHVKTTYTMEISDTADGTYTAVQSADLNNYVTVEDGYKYFFTENAAGKFVKLTIKLDSDAYIIKSSVIDERTLYFKVIDNGYNVYDQDGLSVMNDNTRPELWADIWGCTVDKDGNLQPTDNALTLDADKNALYTYVGNIDWVILHGNITINADKLPADFFWSKDSTATGFDDSETATIKDKFNTAKAAQNAHPDQIGEEQLEGTLIDGDGYNNYYSIAKNNGDSNNNKGLYNTTKVSVSGNYNAITVDKNRTESGRLLKVLVNKETGDKTDAYMQMSQWYLFKMFNPRAAKKDENDNITFEWVEPSDDITFELKNVALTGNGGKTEAVGPQGICMVNTYAIEATIDNVVANGFYTNVGMDNHCTDSPKTQKVIIANTKMYDTYNTMILSWRVAVDVKNSLLKDAGGPVFLLMDGNNRDEHVAAGNTIASPIINVDDKTEMESMAMGTESWYAQLGSTVPAMFGEFQTLDESLKLISGKTFLQPKTVGSSVNNYISVLSIMIPEAGTALESEKDNYKFTGKLVTPADTSDMEDVVFRTIVGTLEVMSTQTKRDLGSVIIKNGSAYIMVWEDSKGERILISPEMLSKNSGIIDHDKYWTVMGLLAAEQQPTDANLADYYADLGTLAQTWRAQKSSQVTIWLQAQTGEPKSPYLGIVIGGYHAVSAQ